MRTLRFTFAMALVSALLVLLAPASALAAGANTTTTTQHKATQTFTEFLPCAGGVYDITITYNEVDHMTSLPNGTFHETSTVTGTFSAVPAEDASLPSFTGHFTMWDGFNGNRQNNTGTFTFTIHGTGSDGSSLDFHETAHVTVNANGTVTSEFDKISC